MTDVITRQIPWSAKHSLGRHVEHDPRSKDHPFEAPRKLTKPASKYYARVGSIFDQDGIGSCTGEALAAACNTKPVYADGRHMILTQPDALNCYEVATQVDGFPGVFPPEDTGSSGVAACKAAQQFGWIGSYQWCFDMDTVLAAIQFGPVCFGSNWYEGFDYPTTAGLVKIAGGIRGGHEYLCRGINTQPRLTKNWLLRLDNSWGSMWGKNGHFEMTVGTMERLLGEQGDCVVPLWAAA
jgi:hypothetical protein